MGQVAIFGGTFDPVHVGHLLLAQTALSQLNLDMIIWVPARCPPHKRGSAYEHRRLMVESAIADHPAFGVASVETARLEPDYAFKTFSDLQDTYPKHQWYWILGLDTFQTLPLWYHREKLIPACEWLVGPRPLQMAETNVRFSNTDITQQQRDTQESWLCQRVAEQLGSQDIPIRWQLLQMPLMGISSTLIRQYCRQHRSIRYLVPEQVRAYIMAHNLYLKSTIDD
ncbi:MAG: nicotinate (nicotinamide) nucleotide adenylyltransferase [Coleofasciculus sp. Co-bin14]|nr:nicotinate (nicotinamide) nucleotide adenylyltransferase [Coleofasciculus sp. Co-bin14]